MHLVFMTRGIDKQVTELKHLLLAQRFPWVRKNLKTGKEELKMVQGALRPIEIWEYVFPEESLNDVLVGMDIKEPIQRKEIKNISWMIRKMLKLDQMPVLEDAKGTGYFPPGKVNGEKIPPLIVHDMKVEALAVYPLGIKKDFKKDHHFTLADGSEVDYFQEGL